MFLGILIALAVFGLILIVANGKAAEHNLYAKYDYTFGIFFLLVGVFGAVGLCIEALL